MASADLENELNCSICLNIFTDPVTISCGHNYCQVCINDVLDAQEGSGVYTCPDCRAEFKTRPALQKSITLCNIVGSFRSSQPNQEETAILCTYCIHSPVPAAKSCLHCECSLCEEHLRVHSKSAEHVLSDPTTSLETRKCSVHKKTLEYYCREDNACICVSCSLAGEHRGHQVDILDVASLRKKEKLRQLLQKLTSKKEEMESSVQNLQKLRREDQEKAAGLAEKVTALFRDIRRQLKDLEKRVLSEISRQEEHASLPVFALIKQLEIKKDKLSRDMRHIEELSNMTDPVTVLEAPETSLLSAATENIETHDVQVHDVGDLDIAQVTNTLHMLCDLITGLQEGIYKQKSTGILPDVNKAGTTKSDLMVGVKKVTCVPKPADIALDETSFGNAESDIITGINIGNYVHVSKPIELDVNTAGYYIYCSSSSGAQWISTNQNCPETPARFLLFNQVLSKTTFSSGQYYCVINVGNSRWWSVGMCYPSIDRRGPQSLIGHNNKSWALCKGFSNRMSLIYDRKEIHLQNNIPCQSVGIYLDYEGGKISFYAEGMTHLHTFTSTFTEPLHALYCVGKDGCIRGSVMSCTKVQ